MVNDLKQIKRGWVLIEMKQGIDRNGRERDWGCGCLCEKRGRGYTGDWDGATTREIWGIQRRRKTRGDAGFDGIR